MTGPGGAVSMEEIQAEIEAGVAAGADPATIKLEGDKIPEALRGKTLADLLNDRAALETAATVANNARKAAEAAVGGREVVREVVREPVKDDPKLTKEQLAELFEKDPISAVAYMQDVALKEASAQFERRFAGLANGSAATVEANIKTQFADEFALFGDEIKKIVDAVPNKEVLTNPDGWKGIISFVRGKEGNFERLVEHRTKKAAEKMAEDARAAQAGGAGVSMSGTGVTGAARLVIQDNKGGDYGLTSDEKRHADHMGISYKDWAFWKNVGG